MSQFSPVTFHGDTIFCVTIENQPYTPAKPIVENLGLDWMNQYRKLTANKDRWGIVMIAIPSASGEQETICLPVRKLPAFLASINPKKVRADLRAKVELYQNECDDALWNYWTEGQATRQTARLELSDVPLTPDQQCTLQAIVKAKVEAIPKEQRSGGLYPQVWSRFNNHFRIARYCQLPQSKLSDAVTYLMAMEIREDKKELPVSSTGLEEECLSLIHDIEEGQRATRMLFVSLNDRFASLSHRLGFEIQRVAKLGSRAAIPDALYHMGYESLSNTLGSKMEGLSVSSNPGYLLLGIARQLKGVRS